MAQRTHLPCIALPENYWTYLYIVRVALVYDRIYAKLKVFDGWRV